MQRECEVEPMLVQLRNLRYSNGTWSSEMTQRQPLTNAEKQKRHRERRKPEHERLRNQLLEAQEEIAPEVRLWQRD
jgi:hypothetical protein